MKVSYQRTIILMVITLIFSQTLSAQPNIDNLNNSSLTDNPFTYHPFHYQKFSNGQSVPLEIAYDTKSVIVSKNSQGVRELDMTNMCHFNLVKSRLDKADIREDEYPQLYKNMELKQQQQQLEKLLPTPMQVSSMAENRELLKGTHLFLDMNVAISLEDDSPYLIIQAKNSVPGGTFTSYLDLLLEDEAGNQLAPLASTLDFYDGKNTITKTIISLEKLKEAFPDLDMIHASSYVETQALDGTITSAMKYTRYPFSWFHIEQAFKGVINDEAKTVNITGADALLVNSQHQYTSSEPTDKNGDDIIRICLHSNHSNCDYGMDVSSSSNRPMLNLPFNGQLVIPHEIEYIYPSDIQMDSHPVGVDEITNVYLQQTNTGSTIKQRFIGVDKQEKHFSDYLHFEVDAVKKQSVISWNIPRDEGYFGDGFEFSHHLQANWHMTFVLKGHPYFNQGSAALPFQVTLSSQHPNTFSPILSPTLPKIEISY